LKYLFLFILSCLICTFARSQASSAPDTIPGYSSIEKVFRNNPYFNFYGTPQLLTIDVRKTTHEEGIFYFILSLLLYIALMRLIFYKYMNAMFTLFFRATLRHQQLREQMLQSPLPALLMNIFFVVALATYFAFLARSFHLHITAGFWSTILYGMIILSVIYTGKFILLHMVGWIFGISGVTDTYLFIVLLVNKMIGIFLLPILILMAFPDPYLLPAVLILSYVMLAGMFLYRFIISYKPVRNEIKLNRLHFFLYLCAFEIAPLLLIYKVLLVFVDSSF
jgi:hypothetical protein